MARKNEKLIHISPELYLSRPRELQSENCQSLSKGLASDVRVADEVTIITAYYSQEFITDLLLKARSGKDKLSKLTLVCGIDRASELMSSRKILQSLQEELEVVADACQVRVYWNRVPLHSKIFSFKQRQTVVYYIGSANASYAVKGARHESMVRITGQHLGLSDYCQHVVRASTDINAPSKHSKIASVRHLLLDGDLCWRPQRALAFSFDPINLSREQRIAMAKDIAASIPYADPAVKGAGFNIIKALDKGQFDSITTGQEAVYRVKYKHNSIETIYGHWMPSIYSVDIKEKLEERRESLRDRWERVNQTMNDTTDESMRERFGRYVKGLKAATEGVSPKIKFSSDIEDRMLRFLKIRRDILNDEDRRERLISILQVEPMPDIWGDPGVIDEFENSFFDDAWSRLDTPGNAARIVKVLKRELKIDVPIPLDEFRTRLEIRVKKGISAEDFWAD